MHGLTGMGMDIFTVFIRTQTLIGSVATQIATELYNGYKVAKLNVRVSNLKTRYIYAAASDMLQILNEVGWVSPLKKIKVRTERSKKILGVTDLLLPEQRQQETDSEKQIANDVGKRNLISKTSWCTSLLSKGLSSLPMFRIWYSFYSFGLPKARKLNVWWILKSQNLEACLLISWETFCPRTNLRESTILGSS
jgi:hypothetical protein